MNDKRVQYFKGEKLVTFLTDSAASSKKKKWPKSLPKVADRVEAINLAKSLIASQFILRGEKMGKGVLNVSRDKEFTEDGYYAWLYEGDATYSNVLTGLVIAGFLACVCFPLWPQFLKVWIWYLSCTLLLVIFGLCIVRGVAFTVFWIGGYEFWILPNLFDESLGVAESFVPVFTFQPAAEGQG